MPNPADSVGLGSLQGGDGRSGGLSQVTGLNDLQWDGEGEDSKMSGDESSTEKCCRELGIDGLTGELLQTATDPDILASAAAAGTHLRENDLELTDADMEMEEIGAGEAPKTPKTPSCSAQNTLPSINKELHNATLQGDPELVRKLISLGAMVNAPINSKEEDGDVFVTLLHLIAGRTDLPKGTEVLAEIVRGKANLNARSFLGVTPLARACLHKHRCAVEMLLQFGADTTPVDDRGRNALRCAVWLQGDAVPSDSQEVSGGLVSLLASSKANMDDGGDATPLLQAVRQANRPAVLALIEHGAKPATLHAAVEQAPMFIIEDLLKAQANPFEADSDGKSVLDIAFRRGDEDITSLLRDFIGDLERQHMRDVNKGPWKRQSVTMANPVATPIEVEEEPTLGLSSDLSQRRANGLRQSIEMTASDASNEARRRFAGISSAVWAKKAGGSPKRRTRKRRRLLGERFGRFQLACRRLNRNRNFQMVMFAALLMVLFFPDLWVVFDVDGNDGLDAILITLMLLFFAELMLQTIGTPNTYINSFFFWMDMIGLLSVPLDLSVVTDNLPQTLDNAVVVRAARTARLGARAGRFTKLVKLLRFLPGVSTDDGHESGGTAKTMSNTLNTSLSTRVSCLIIVMVIVLPLFEMATYPENDFSMKAWMNSLDFTLQRYGATVMQQRLSTFEHFYSDKDYYPLEVQWTANGSQSSLRLEGRRPARKRNEIEIQADSGDLLATFNFGSQNRTDSICNILLIIVIILLMMGFSMLLSNSVSNIVLRPLENLLDRVKQTSARIFESVTEVADACVKKDSQDPDDDSITGPQSNFGNETELLEKVIGKLANLSAITMKTTAIDNELLNDTDRAVLQGFNIEQMQQMPNAIESEGSEDRDAMTGTHSKQLEDNAESLTRTLGRFVAQAGLSWTQIDSWNFDVLALEEMQRQLCCLSFLIFHLGLGYTTEMQGRLASFVEVAAQGYSIPTKVPYHNWCHGVDVTHTVFRLLNLCAAERFLSNLERYSLIVSAICHDVGHPGLNNPFLIETAHELAIRYNDHSPLENMHCARLFEIASQPKTAVFDNFDQREYREARQVCIEAILHTDNVHHFGMVKEMQILYEVNCELFDATYHMMGQVDFPPREICDVLGEPERRKSIRNLFLHYSDISNPMKPFDICKKWAWNIIDEFFAQGDMEKELGIAVQPLNDREKVNKPYCQIGFNEFFVAPFALASCRILPPLIPCAEQMMQNVETWFEEWHNTTEPTPDPEELAKVQDRVVKLGGKCYFRDGQKTISLLTTDRHSERHASDSRRR